MLKRRIIPCLDVRDGRTVKGVQFKGIRDAGDPLRLAHAYSEQGADELVLLDISATLEGRAAMLDLVTAVAREVRIPFTVGGGIRVLEDVGRLLDAGADKVSINSAALARPQLIGEVAGRYGSQCCVVALDVGPGTGARTVYTRGGTRDTGIDALQWAVEAVARGAGELLVTSMTADGTLQGFDLPLMRALDQAVNVPLIASGGAGNADHFAELFATTGVEAGLAASIFHDGLLPIPELKRTLKSQQLPIR